METYKIDRLKVTMWLVEWKNAWQDWMEDYKISKSSDNVIDCMRNNTYDDVFNWMNEFITKWTCDCLNEIIYDWSKWKLT
jgi:hypothetical protein